MIITNQLNKLDEKSKNKKIGTTKKGFFAVFLFYFLVAFEFAYMAGPFAVYFYSLYSPILVFLNKVPGLSWLTKFFLPHVVRETSSSLLKIIEVAGILLTLVGFILFLVGAFQIYYSKLAKKGAVVRGLYKYVRHPQYASFILCSFGLLLLWPRYIVVILFVSLLFVYMALAKAEEKECAEKYGDSYTAYMQKTGRFFPYSSYKVKKTNEKISMGMRFFSGLIAYLITLSVFLLIAMGLRSLTVNSLYAAYDKNSATIALCKIDKELIETIVRIAKTDENVQSYFSNSSTIINELNYILPAEWFAAEIPMNGVEYRKGHKSPKSYDSNRYKIIFSEAIVNNSENMNGKKILDRTMSIAPIVEVWVDVTNNKVTEIKDMPESIKYKGIPVAIF